ncbi:MAG: ankyrin repeat domain-containing protein [Rickettsiaceae bacterium]|nr:ankyrin repeat domain-containing protein [Rickettsiaceae bacterium]
MKEKYDFRIKNRAKYTIPPYDQENLEYIKSEIASGKTIDEIEISPNLSFSYAGFTTLNILEASIIHNHNHTTEYLIGLGAHNIFNVQSELLAYCINSNFDEIVNIILTRSDLNPNYALKDGITPLLAACSNDDIGLIQILLDKGADIDASDTRGMGVLLRACYSAHAKESTEIVDFLIARGADIIKTSENGHNLLMAAIYSCNQILINKILDLYTTHNFDDYIWAANDEGASSLMLASRTGNLETVKLLIQKGLNIYDIDKKGENTLMYACESGSEELIDYIVSLYSNPQKDLSIKNYNGRDVFLKACEKGNINIIQKLIDLGANPFTEDNYHNNAVIQAARFNNFEAIELLESYGVNLDHRNKGGTSALMVIARFGDGEDTKVQEFIKFLLDHGVDTSFINQNIEPIEPENSIENVIEENTELQGDNTEF